MDVGTTVEMENGAVALVTEKGKLYESSGLDYVLAVNTSNRTMLPSVYHSATANVCYATVRTEMIINHVGNSN